MNAQLHDIKSVLREAGFKCTQPRELVLQALAKCEKPIAIDELHTTLKKRVHLVTLYRILRDFVSAGLVYQTDFRTGKAFYEYQSAHHHHVVCTSCGKRAHIDACVSLPQGNISGFKEIQNHSLEFFGVCTACNKRRLHSK